MPSEDEAAFVDANIFVYAAMEDAPQHEACRSLLESGRKLCVSSQVLAEFYSIVTSPRRVSAPFTPTEAVSFIVELLPRVEVLPVLPSVVVGWTKLAEHLGITGADVFDLQIVATMLEHGVRHIYTFNRGDFESFTELNVLTP